MAGIYDIAKLRDAARQVRRVADHLDEDAVFGMRRAEESMEGWNGKAADALMERILEEARSLRTEVQQMADVSAKLRAYADLLDEADSRLAALMGGR